MKIARALAMVFGLLMVLVCSWIAPLDAPAMAQVDAGVRRALISFASARAINGVLSVVQAAQLDIQPAGIGVTLSPFQLLAPVNELVRHFADLMLMACIAFGIQKVMISISGYWLISLALTLVVLAWGLSRLRQNQTPRWLSRALVLILMLRFAIPLAVLGTDALSQRFLAADYTTAQTSIDTTAIQVSAPVTSSGSWLSKVPSMAGVQDEYNKIKQHSTEHIVKLIVVFLLQTLVLPLLMIWALYGITKLSFERPRLSLRHERQPVREILERT